MTTTTALAAEIRAEMARRRLTPADMATALGIHRVTASAICNGRAPINMERLDSISAWFDLRASELLLRADSTPETAA